MTLLTYSQKERKRERKRPPPREECRQAVVRRLDREGKNGRAGR